MNGIDVSKWNGDIDYKRVRDVDFVIIRAGFGKMLSQKDPKFEQNYANAKAAGFSVGAYHYSYAKNSADAQEEAKCFLKWIEGKKFDYPVYFDIEDKSQADLSRKTLTDICIAWCSAVEKAGYYVGIYANPDWFNNKLDLNRLTKYDKWLAHWTDKPWKGNEFGGLWQYSDKGRISGISGDVDLNKSYRNYPSIIKEAGLNGYGSTVDITATKKNITKANAEKIKTACENLGMTVKVSD